VALKKSELYSSLWSSCDELRGGMDASQYKDYVLVLLFIKYVSDKYAGVRYAPIEIPDGASFKDMVALKGKPDIGRFDGSCGARPLQDRVFRIFNQIPGWRQPQ
jgi:type I restriction enzyme M protein